LVHLRNELVGRGEFSIGNPNLGFAIAEIPRWRKSRGDRYHCLLDNPTGSNPRLRMLKGPGKVTDIIGQLPRQIDMLPMQDISLDSSGQPKTQGPRFRPTYMIELPDGMPAHGHNEIRRNMFGSSHQMGLDGHQVVGYGAGDGGLHDGREKLERRGILVGRPRYRPAIIGGTQALVFTHGPPTPPI